MRVQPSSLAKDTNKQSQGAPPNKIEVGNASSETHHFWSEAETAAYVDWINQQLSDDPDLKDVLPLSKKGTALFEACHDGLLLAKLVNSSVDGTINENQLTKRCKMTIHKSENLIKVIAGCRAIGVQVHNIGPEDIMSATPHLCLGIVWQIIKVGLLANVTPQLGSIEGINGSIESVANMEKTTSKTKSQTSTVQANERALLVWFNKCLEKVQYDKKITNFGNDLANSLALAHLVSYLTPSDVAEPINITQVSQETDLVKRAELVLDAADQYGCRAFASPKDIAEGSKNLNMAFVAVLYNNRAAATEAEWKAKQLENELLNKADEAGRLKNEKEQAELELQTTRANDLEKEKQLRDQLEASENSKKSADEYANSLLAQIEGLRSQISVLERKSEQVTADLHNSNELYKKSQSDVAGLEEEKSQLQKKVSEYSFEISELQEETEKLQTELENVRNQLLEEAQNSRNVADKANSEIDNLRYENGLLRQSNQNLTTETAKAQDLQSQTEVEVQALRSEVDSQQTRVGDLEREIATMETEKTRIITEKTEIEHRIAIVQEKSSAENVELQNLLKTTQEELAGSQEEVSSLRKANQDLEAVRDNLKSQLDEARATSNQEINNLDTLLAEAQANTQALTREVVSITSTTSTQINDLNVVVIKYENELEQALNSSRELAKTNQKEIESLQQQLKEQKESADEQEGFLQEALRDSANELDKIFNESNSIIHHMQTRIVHLTEEKNETSMFAIDLNKAINELEKELEQALSHIENDKSEVEYLRSQVSQAHANAQKLSDEVESIKGAAAEQIVELKTTIVTLKTQVEEASTKIEQDQAEIDNLKSRLEAAENKSKQLISEVEQIKSISTEHVKELKHTIVQIETRLVEIRTEKTDLESKAEELKNVEQELQDLRVKSADKEQMLRESLRDANAEIERANDETAVYRQKEVDAVGKLEELEKELVRLKEGLANVHSQLENMQGDAENLSSRESLYQEKKTDMLDELRELIERSRQQEAARQVALELLAKESQFRMHLQDQVKKQEKNVANLTSENFDLKGQISNLEGVQDLLEQEFQKAGNLTRQISELNDEIEQLLAKNTELLLSQTDSTDEGAEIASKLDLLLFNQFNIVTQNTSLQTRTVEDSSSKIELVEKLKFLIDQLKQQIVGRKKAIETANEQNMQNIQLQIQLDEANEKLNTLQKEPSEEIIELRDLPTVEPQETPDTNVAEHNRQYSNTVTTTINVTKSHTIVVNNNTTIHSNNVDSNQGDVYNQQSRLTNVQESVKDLNSDNERRESETLPEPKPLGEAESQPLTSTEGINRIQEIKHIFEREMITMDSTFDAAGLIKKLGELVQQLKQQQIARRVATEQVAKSHQENLRLTEKLAGVTRKLASSQNAEERLKGEITLLDNLLEASRDTTEVKDLQEKLEAAENEIKNKELAIEALNNELNLAEQQSTEQEIVETQISEVGQAEAAFEAEQHVVESVTEHVAQRIENVENIDNQKSIVEEQIEGLNNIESIVTTELTTTTSYRTTEETKSYTIQAQDSKPREALLRKLGAAIEHMKEQSQERKAALDIAAAEHKEKINLARQLSAAENRIKELTASIDHLRAKQVEKQDKDIAEINDLEEVLMSQLKGLATERDTIQVEEVTKVVTVEGSGVPDGRQTTVTTERSIQGNQSEIDEVLVRLRSKISNLEAEVALHSAGHQDVIDRIEEESEELSQMEQIAASDLHEANKLLRMQKLATDVAIDSASEERSRRLQLEKDIKAANIKIVDLEQKSEVFKERIAEMGAEREHLRDLVGHAESSKNYREDELKFVTQIKEERMREKDEQISELRKKLDTTERNLVSQIAEMETAVQEEQHEKAQASDDLVNSEIAIRQLESEVESLQGRAAEYQTERIDFLEKIASLEKQLVESDSQNDRNLTTIRNEVIERNTTINVLQQKTVVLEKQNTKKLLAIEDNAQGQLQRKLFETEQQLAETRAQLQDANGRLENDAQELKDNQVVLEQVKIENIAQKKESAVNLFNATEELKEKESKLATVEEKLVHIETVILERQKSANDQVATETLANIRLREELALTKLRSEELVEEIESLKQNIRDLLNENKRQAMRIKSIEMSKNLIKEEANIEIRRSLEQVSEKEQVIQSMKERLDASNKFNTARKIAVETAAAEHYDNVLLQERLEQAIREADRAAFDARQLEDSIKHSEEYSEELKSKLLELEDETALLKRDNYNVLKASLNSIEDKDSEIKTLSSKLDLAERHRLGRQAAVETAATNSIEKIKLQNQLDSMVRKYEEAVRLSEFLNNEMVKVKDKDEMAELQEKYIETRREQLIAEQKRASIESYNSQRSYQPRSNRPSTFYNKWAASYNSNNSVSMASATSIDESAVTKKVKSNKKSQNNQSKFSLQLRMTGRA